MIGQARARSHALLVDTYADLRKHAAAFADGHLSFVLLTGSAGIGKSRAFRDLVKNRAAWVDGNATAFAVYLEAHKCCDKPIVIDDSDGLLRDRAGVRLLKALTQTEKHRTVGWHSKAPEEYGVPRRFTTSSAVVVITNEWAPATPDMVALEDRSHFLHFAPSNLDIHCHAADWFWDQPIFNFVGEHLHLIPRHSLRVYQKAYQQKLAGLDWRRFVLGQCVEGAVLAALMLRHDSGYRTEEDRARAFVAAGLGSRATYFNYIKRLRPATPAPAIVLKTTVPPDEQEPPPVADEATRESLGSGETGTTGATESAPPRTRQRREKQSPKPETAPYAAGAAPISVPALKIYCPD